MLVESERSLHALRSAARVVALNAATPNRWDFEGMSDVDVELISDSGWKRFLCSLSVADASAFNVVRSGAVWNPSKRYAGSHRLSSVLSQPVFSQTFVC